MNYLFLLSLLTFVLMLVPANIVFIAGAFIFCLIVSAILKIKQIDLKFEKSNDTIFMVISGIVSLLFYYRWIPSSIVAIIANIIHIPNYVFLFIITLIGFVLCNVFFMYVKPYILIENKLSTDKLEIKKINNKEILFLLLIAIVTISIFSKSSILYPFNDWVDSNCFFTVGKSVLSGKVIYADLFEQKGPLLYFIHTLASLISYKTFFGVYLIEICACFFTLLFGYKLLLLYVDRKVIYLLPFWSFITYGSAAFCHGDSAEELCLPLLMYGLYIGIKALKQNDVPTKMEAILLGITSGMVLWIKYTLLGFYIGWIIVPAYILIKEKEIKKLFTMIVRIAFGVILISIPILLYFVVNDAVVDLFEVYFYNNMFLYGTKDSSILYSLSNGITTYIYYNQCTYYFILLGYLCGQKRKELINCLLIFGIMCFFFFFSNPMAYYGLPLVVMSIFGIRYIYLLMNKYSLFKMTHAIMLLLAVITFINNQNIYLMFKDKNDMPQYKFAEIINKEDNPTLLNYGFLDGGFYTTAGIVPNNKYFAKLNIDIDEMLNGQDECIKNKEVEFIVKRGKEFQFDGYKRIAKTSYYFESKVWDYYLYQLEK